jgi:hypothetical protein
MTARNTPAAVPEPATHSRVLVRAPDVKRGVPGDARERLRLEADVTGLRPSRGRPAHHHLVDELPRLFDWIGLFKVGARNEENGWYQYLV